MYDFVLSNLKSDPSEPSNQSCNIAKHNAAEQEFYEEHGGKAPQRILWLITWIENKINPKT